MSAVAFSVKLSQATTQLSRSPGVSPKSGSPPAGSPEAVAARALSESPVNQPSSGGSSPTPWEHPKYVSVAHSTMISGYKEAIAPKFVKYEGVPGLAIKNPYKIRF